MGNCITVDGAPPSAANKITRLFRVHQNGHHMSAGGIDCTARHNGGGSHVIDLITGDLPLRSSSGHLNNLLHDPANNKLVKPSDNSNKQLSNLLNNNINNNSTTKSSQQMNNHLNNNNSSCNNNNNNLDPTQPRIMICTIDFVANDECDLSVRRGDRLMVSDTHYPDWIFAEHLASKRSGFVPRNFVVSEAIEMEEWFFPKINRSQAEKLLLMDQNCRGTFLVRNSEQIGQTGYSLSIKDQVVSKDDDNNATISNNNNSHHHHHHHQQQQSKYVGHVKHYRIKTLDNGGYFVATRNTFRTVSELINFYSKNANGLCHKLVRPCPKPKPHFWPDRGDEIQRAELTFGRKIGAGCFGEVYRGRYRNSFEVAIKTLKQGTMSPQAFLEEAVIMRNCRHPNLVPLYGVCSQGEPLLIITEFMSNGSLLEYLRNNPEGESLQLGDLIDMANQIAEGMKYLEQKKLIHRDLAARNILVNDHRVVKVADFGLARVIEDSEYTARQGAKFPIKWTAPEAAMYGKFSIKSDVWSYGILLYELFTYGSIPYPGMLNKEVIEQVQRGYRLPRPTNVDCPEEVYRIMIDCWHSDPDKRPTFEFLADFFKNYFVASEESYRDAGDCC